MFGSHVMAGLVQAPHPKTRGPVGWACPYAPRGRAARMGTAGYAVAHPTDWKIQHAALARSSRDRRWPEKLRIVLSFGRLLATLRNIVWSSSASTPSAFMTSLTRLSDSNSARVGSRYHQFMRSPLLR